MRTLLLKIVSKSKEFSDYLDSCSPTDLVAAGFLIVLLLGVAAHFLIMVLAYG